MMKKIFLAVVFLQAVTLLSAQDTTLHFSVNHFAFSVNNVDSSVAFYQRTLGFAEITNRTKATGVRWLSMGEGKELHFISTVKTPVVTINKAVHFAFATPDFAAFVRRLDALGLAYSDWNGTPHTVATRADGIRQVYFQDLDGYWIEVNSVR